MEHLWDQRATASGYGGITTREIADKTGMISKTALRTLEDLLLVGLVKRTRAGDYDNAPYRWSLTEDAEDLIKGGGVFQR